MPEDDRQTPQGNDKPFNQQHVNYIMFYKLQESESISKFKVEDYNGGNYPLKAGSRTAFFTMKHEDGKSTIEEMTLGQQMSRISITADGKINNRQLYAQIEKGYKVAGFEYDDEHGGFLFHLILKSTTIEDVLAEQAKDLNDEQGRVNAVVARKNLCEITLEDVHVPSNLSTDDGEYKVHISHFPYWKIPQSKMTATIANGKIDLASALETLEDGYGSRDDHRWLSGVSFNAPSKTIMLDFDS